MMLRARAGWIGAWVVLCVAATVSSVTADEPSPSETALFKLVQGVVSAVGPQGIAVETRQGEDAGPEMYLPFDTGLKLQGVVQVRDIQSGDHVVVEYRESARKSDSGEMRVSRVAVRVTLMKRAPPVLEEPAAEDETAEAPDA
jgi:hypothetical protein